MMIIIRGQARSIVSAVLVTIGLSFALQACGEPPTLNVTASPNSTERLVETVRGFVLMVRRIQEPPQELWTVHLRDESGHVLLFQTGEMTNAQYPSHWTGEPVSFLLHLAIHQVDEIPVTITFYRQSEALIIVDIGD